MDTSNAPGFVLCPTCDQLTLTRVWVHGKAAVKKGKVVIEEAIASHWKTLDVPIRPITGDDHLCATAHLPWVPPQGKE
jgi:hypothetical protein